MSLHKKQTAKMTLCFSRHAMQKDCGVCFNFYYPSSNQDCKWRYEADIICVDIDFNVHEIEVKRTLSDFRQEHCKSAKFDMMLKGEYYTNYFSYLIPIEIYEKIKYDIHPMYGIYTINDKRTRVTKRREPSLLKSKKCDDFLFVAILRQSTKNLWRFYEKSNKL